MKKIRIITDSASDISQQNSDGIVVLPITVRFGDTEYQDGVSISHSEFYERLAEQLPVTSLVSPFAFEEAFGKAVNDGEQVIAITISSKLSGTYQSALLAAEGFGDDVLVVDSMNATIGQQILVMRAVELIGEGLPADAIVERLNREKDKIHVLGVLDTLKYLKKGGRISGTVAFVGGALSIKPVVAIRGGQVVMVGKARGSKNGNNYLVKEIEGTRGIDFDKPLRLGYTGLTDTYLKRYIDDSEHLWSGHAESLVISTMGPTIGTHIGPGVVAIGFFEKEEENE